MQANGTPLRLAAPTDPASTSPLEEVAELRTKAVNDAVAVVPLTYSRQQLAEALGIDVATLDRWTASGRLGVRPLRISGPRGRVLFSRQEVADWVAAGCPEAEGWKSRRAARNGK